MGKQSETKTEKRQEPVTIISATGLAHLVNSLGTTDFPHALLAFLNLSIRIDHLSLFILDSKRVPQAVGGAGLKGDKVFRQAAHTYSSKVHYLQDPNIRSIGSNSRTSESPLIFRLKANDISNPAYKAEIYQANNLIDRMSLLDNTRARWYVLNCYRDLDTGEFDNAELILFEHLSRSVSALIRQHLALSPPQTWEISSLHPPVDMLEQVVSTVSDQLTKREIAVCARALQGMTNAGIALELGIQESTVGTFRKRAYRKLKICGLNELFALCLFKLT